MVKSNRIFATSVAVLCAFRAHDACAAQNTPTFMSKYGEIQSVNKYSSNPFWTPNSPYNQRFPTPIYATGADLNAGDCNRIVGNLVSEYCTGHNYCSNSRLADVRPTVMVQLSQLPGHNFATSCGGYIDSIFENYKKTYGNTSTNNVVKPAQQNVATIQIENPFKQTKSEYEIGVAERAAELESLQKQTTPNAELSATAFPKTIDDLSFTDRVANTTAGYEPYKDLSAYKTPKFETEDEFLERLKDVNIGAYCARIVNPQLVPKCNPQTQINITNNANSDATITDDSNQLAPSELESDAIKVDTIVEILNPQNTDEEKFFKALAAAYVAADRKNSDVLLDKNFIYDFLGNGDNLDTYHNGLITQSGTVYNEEFGIDIDWDEVLTDISIVLDNTVKKRSIKVCENNRSLQVGLDAVLWAATAVATVATFGGGGVAIASARAAAGAGLKALAKGTAKIGLKKAGVKMSKLAGKQLVKSGMRKVYSKQGTKAVVKQATRNLVKQAGRNLSDKTTLLLTSGVIAAQIGHGVAKRNATGVLYSLVSSQESTEILNCQDLDHGEGCYTICGDGLGNDELNNKVFQPILGKKYCVSKEDYVMYEIKPNGQMGEVMVFDDAVYPKLRQSLINIKDRGKCDWNEDDIDAYIGYFIYDPDTLEISKEALYIDDLVRLDD